MMKRSLIFLCIASLITACSTYKVKNLNENIDKNEYQKVTFITNIDAFSSKKEVGNFNVVEMKKEWIDIKKNLLTLAKDNYANAIVVDEFQLLGKGIKGKLYQVDIDELNEVENAEKARKLVVFRDELGSLLTTNFKTEVSINNETEKLKDKTFKVITLDENQDSFEIEINGKSEVLELTNGTNYFWVSRQISTNQTGGNGLSVSIGGQNILKIEDLEMAKIWVGALKVEN